MAKVVYILGAGASRKAGVPLMNGFIARARALMNAQNGHISRDAFGRVLKVRDALRALHATAQVELDNIEELFDLIEMGKIVGGLPGVPDEDIDATATALTLMVAQTIEESCEFPARDAYAFGPKPYDALADCMKNRWANANPCDWAFITFNYDIALDFALQSVGFSVDYGLGGRSPVLLPFTEPERGRVKILKLHGSLNWSRCECGAFFPIDWKLFANPDRSPVARLRPTAVLRKATHCGKPNTGDVGIVPPSWNKTQYKEQVAPVWRRAKEELSSAERIIIAGYSLPPTDAFFRDLFRLGAVGHLKSVSFVNTDQSVAKRFETLLGSEFRDRFRPNPDAFESVLTNLLEIDSWPE